MNIIILGPPGSGKGTQARRIVESLNLSYFESGEFSRKLAKASPRIEKIVGGGGLIPEEEMTKYVAEYLEKEIPGGRNILFDGYPRFITQYKFLEHWLENEGSRIDKVFLFEVSDKETIRRLSARRICGKCGTVYNLITNPPPGERCKCGGELIQRDDDKPEVIKERLKVYKENTLPMVEYIEKRGILERVDAERPIDTIYLDLIQRIEKEDVKK
jgi:adenylate kinase